MVIADYVEINNVCFEFFTDSWMENKSVTFFTFLIASTCCYIYCLLCAN